MCSVLLFKDIFTEVQYGQPAANRGYFVQFLIDILMIMMETQALTSHFIHGLKNIIMETAMT